MLTANLVAIALLMSGAWWLSRYDSHVTGEDERADFARRAIRCGITLLLLLLAIFGGILAVPIFIFIGVIWASPGAEFLSRQFHKLIDPDDNRAFDPTQTERKLDLLGKLAREKRVDEALMLCDEMEKSGEASPMVLEATLYHLYQHTLDSIDTSPLLAEPLRLCELDQLEPAETQLRQLLARDTKNWAAMLLLMRIYAEGLSQPDKARAFFQPVNNQSPLHPAFIKYAERSIAEWSRVAANRLAEEQPPLLSAVPSSTAAQPAAPAPEVSLDELLKNGQRAAAIERLEKGVHEQPGNFGLWLKLAEAHAVYCADPNRAGKIIQKMQSASAFTPQEIELAKAKLREWQAPRRANPV
jgi:pentatricopeptide repeat protein